MNHLQVTKNVSTNKQMNEKMDGGGCGDDGNDDNDNNNDDDNNNNNNNNDNKSIFPTIVTSFKK
jgi:hypothetical protein